MSDWSWTPDETGLEDTGVPWLATDLMEEAMRCHCEEGEGDGPLCARCECLMRLVEAIEEWGDALTTLDDAEFPCLDGGVDDGAACPWCGEEGCERSCTGALLEDQAGEAP